ncbi:MAG: hypothetical protein U9R58_11715 [Chloroflexota bacterium]|nr:hypothetical protein [Chloroflexota bacterium]
MNELLHTLNEYIWLGRLLYLDPGSGSVIFQLLIAGLVGAGFIIRLYWKRITGIFSKRGPEDEEPTSDEDQ